jgi:hypothetical protein
MLFWFSKPERAMNKRVNEYHGEHEQRQKVMKEKIESLRDKLTDYQSELQAKLQLVFEVITGKAKDDKQLSFNRCCNPREVKSAPFK